VGGIVVGGIVEVRTKVSKMVVVIVVVALVVVLGEQGVTTQEPQIGQSIRGMMAMRRYRDIAGVMFIYFLQSFSVFLCMR
jgi:hypothetical protein